MHPLERLINLVAMLLEARRPLTFEQIREALPAYAQDDLATAKRMFERDKDILRDNGIPIEMSSIDPFGVEEGYVIPKDRYYLPEIAFTAQEISALFVAAHSGGEDAFAEQAVRKLLYGAEGGVIAGVAGPLATVPDVDADRLNAVAEAVLRGSRCIGFGYTTSRGASSERRLDAYGLVWRAGRWYVVGRDRDREGIRAFRLSRISTAVTDAGEGSEPPAGFRAAEHVELGPWGPGEPVLRATIAFSPEVAWWAAEGIEQARVGPTGADGWVEVTVPAGPEDSLASWILGFGSEARVVAPDSLRDEVVRRLEAVLAAG